MVVRKTGKKVTGFEPDSRRFESIGACEIYQLLKTLTQNLNPPTDF